MQVAFRTFAVRIVFNAITQSDKPLGPGCRDVRRFNHNHPGSAIAAAHIYTAKLRKEKHAGADRILAIRLTDQAHLLGKIEAPIWANRRGYTALLLISGLWRLRLEPGS